MKVLSGLMLKSVSSDVEVVVVIVLALAGPAIRGSEAISVSNVEIYMVVDRTGSMAAEDYQGKGPDGVDQSKRGCIAAFRLPGPSAFRFVTRMIWPPLPPGVSLAQPTAPGCG